MELKGQNILVTGASQGIGAAVARELLGQGGRIIAHYNKNREAAESLAKAHPDSKVATLAANLENPAETEELFRKSLEALGHLDALVLNAGVFLPHPPEMATADWWQVWRKTLAINLDACGLLTKLALEHFKMRGGGRLVYIGSRAAFRGETEDFLGYAASKGGLTSLARSVARAFGRDRIVAFTIAPGFTRTEMAETFIRQKGEKILQDEIALPNLTVPGDIAPLVAFMCSGKMDHATGTTVDMNAGSYMH
ncbi:SDR family NAD(P)-dependent oxidoreductase [Robiginitalea biformata]|uniref:NAD dependent epimerase/dehydratase family protein n=1 Tax=Robiginitalea biformata (strain ATCC BAA-864 / DSM 15991 / KCTC 12146 / HTCC2501) TaxID=313596 RepID=A4CL74_ROBBH|nr:SDR family oxidoreductase [Robiginitalea biformata]EAR15623.1 NAD dependent epimerase/dehydratase family protein [Robiginitalea biformata HTCC2501]